MFRFNIAVIMVLHTLLVATSNGQSLSGKEIATEFNTTQLFSADNSLLIQSSMTSNPSPHYSTTSNPTQQFSANNLLLQSSTTTDPSLQYSVTENPTEQLSTKNMLLHSSMANNPSLQSSYGTAIRNKTDNLKSSQHDDLQTSSQLQIYAVWGYGWPRWSWGYGIPVWGYGRPGWGYGRRGWGYGRRGWGYGRPGWGYGRRRW